MSFTFVRRCLLLSILPLALHAGEPAPAGSDAEARLLKNVRQLTFAGSKNGEAYFSHDGKQVIFQGVREAGNPFYQIYRINLAGGELTRVSSGVGRTTCSFFHPKKNRVIFASTHLDAQSVQKQKDEIEKLKAGPPKRYAWDFDPYFDIFEAEPDGSKPVQLTTAQGYDAECAYSPDGRQIVFCSMRDGDHEIYVMDADGKNQRRLTHEKGYDGGPFFSPDGRQIVWRHFEDEAQKVAEVWVMDADGLNKRQITNLKSVTWAPYWHPNMQWIVFASNFEDPAFEVYAIRPDGSKLTRLTHSPTFDGLPVISPDGATLMWTSNRSGNKSQIFMAELQLPGDEPRKPRVSDKELAEREAELIAQASMYAGASAAGELEHTVASQLRKASLYPLGKTEKQDASAYIHGPSVCGWLPGAGENDSRVLVLGRMAGGIAAGIDISMLVRAAKAVESNDKNRASRSPACHFAAAYEEELKNVIAAEYPGQPTKAAVVLSFCNGMSNTLVIRGAGSSPAFRELAERVAARNPDARIVIEDDPASVPGFTSFSDKKIPCILLTDSVEVTTADAERSTWPFAMDAAVDLVRLLARGDLKFEYTPYDAAAVKAAATAGARPYLGTVPEYKTEGITGVKLSGTRDGSPAQKAGAQAGDVIVELAGKPIKDVNEYMAVLETLKPGEPTTLKVQRGAETLTLELTPGSR